MWVLWENLKKKNATWEDTGVDAIILKWVLNPLNAELYHICPLLALFRAHHILHIRR
jgi:hypothetical protein